MERSLKLISNRKRDIKNILDDIKTDNPDTIKDYYELSNELFDFLKSIDDKWLEKFCDMVTSFIDMEIVFDSDNDIRSFFLKSKHSNKDFIKYFFDGLKLCNVVNKKDESSDDSDTESSDDVNKNDDECDQIEIENNKDIVKQKFIWRDGQQEALQKIINNDFSSGLISMITGSGKSLIFLKTIANHFSLKNPKIGSIYILLCPRIDILKSLFFDYDDKSKKIILDKTKIKYWLSNNIINLNNFNVIDCVNNNTKNVKFDNEKYNLLLINNDSFRVLYKNDQSKTYIDKNTNLVILDECQCLSGIQIYKILEEMKYEHKISIIGFSATAIRDSKKSVENVINILSKTYDINKKDKKINLIYSYDLLQGIKDNVVLPYRIECVKINKIKSHKIGITNKNILEDLLKKLIDVKTKKLPYKKIVIWTNRKDIMRECYLFIKEYFKELKVYCTSSFDNEFFKDGFNTNYEEFYKNKEKSILICINKCKEGSDIPYVDCGIYFDGVKNRSILVHIQTSGRLIRPDKDGKKTHGDLIDTFILDENEKPHTLTAQKILSYLTRLLNLSDDEYDDQIEYYKQMSMLAENMEYNSIEQTLKIKIDNNKKHDTLIELKKMEILQMDWLTIKNELIKQVDKKFCISEEQKQKMLFTDLKKIIKNLNIKTKESYITNSQKGFVVKNPDKQFVLLWKGWYDFLGIDINNFPSKEKWLKICEEKNIRTDTDYKKFYIKYNLPELPKELYDVDDIDYELSTRPKKINRRKK